jgi:hypothetical protein
MGAGLVSVILTLLVGWVVAILLTYPIMRAISPKHAVAALFVVIVGPLVLLAILIVR